MVVDLFLWLVQILEVGYFLVIRLVGFWIEVFKCVLLDRGEFEIEIFLTFKCHGYCELIESF